jgi:hypothetical protein
MRRGQGCSRARLGEEQSHIRLEVARRCRRRARLRCRAGSIPVLGGLLPCGLRHGREPSRLGTGERGGMRGIGRWTNRLPRLPADELSVSLCPPICQRSHRPGCLPGRAIRKPVLPDLASVLEETCAVVSLTYVEDARVDHLIHRADANQAALSVARKQPRRSHREQDHRTCPPSRVFRPWSPALAEG